MVINEATAYYHSLLKFGIKPGLERIRALAHALGDPHNDLQFIHIAGTNGKGSTAIMLSEIFQAAGYRTGLFISPYISDFRERIQIDGEPIDEATLCMCTEKVKAAIEGLNEEITEFEAVTAAAFLCYKEKCCDMVVLETGLGGRFDATNIIKAPLASVITSISLDHTNILGDTVEKIAFEKAGIIKPGSPVVIPCDLPKEAFTVIHAAAAKNESPLLSVDCGSISVCDESLNGFTESYNGITFKINIPGDVQSVNAALAVRTALLCGISPENTIKGIENAKNPARCELISHDPLIILDGSHNDKSTKNLSELLKRHLKGKKILVLMGMMADKDIDKALDNLLPCFEKVITTSPSNPRAIPADQLSVKITEKGKLSAAVPDPIQALDICLEEVKNYDALVICGSLYLAGDVREYLIQKMPD